MRSFDAGMTPSLEAIGSVVEVDAFDVVEFNRFARQCQRPLSLAKSRFRAGTLDESGRATARTRGAL